MARPSELDLTWEYPDVVWESYRSCADAVSARREKRVIAKLVARPLNKVPDKAEFSCGRCKKLHKHSNCEATGNARVTIRLDSNPMVEQLNLVLSWSACEPMQFVGPPYWVSTQEKSDTVLPVRVIPFEQVRQSVMMLAHHRWSRRMGTPLLPKSIVLLIWSWIQPTFGNAHVMLSLPPQLVDTDVVARLDAKTYNLLQGATEPEVLGYFDQTGTGRVTSTQENRRLTMFQKFKALVVKQPKSKSPIIPSGPCDWVVPDPKQLLNRNSNGRILRNFGQQVYIEYVNGKLCVGQKRFDIRLRRRTPVKKECKPRTCLAAGAIVMVIGGTRGTLQFGVDGLFLKEQMLQRMTMGTPTQSHCSCEAELHRPSCWDGTALVTMADGSVRATRDLRVGDLVKTPNPKGRSEKNVATKAARINQIFSVMAPLGEVWKLVPFHGFHISHHHPVVHNGEWRLPKEIHASDRVLVEGLWNFELQEDAPHHTMEVNGAVVSTLGCYCGPRIAAEYPDMESKYGAGYWLQPSRTTVKGDSDLILHAHSPIAVRQRNAKQVLGPATQLHAQKPARRLKHARATPGRKVHSAPRYVSRHTNDDVRAFAACKSYYTFRPQ